MASSLNNLANVARAQGQLELASAYHQRALEIQENLAPDSLDLARSLHNLGLVARDRGQLELASAYYQRALEILEKLAPDSLDLAKSLNNLGVVARDRGQLELASAYYQRALEIREKLAPDSLDLAGSLNDLGEATRARGDIDRAADLFQRAILTLEAQIANLGSSHDFKASLRAQHGKFYRNAIETQLQLHRPNDAFHLLERSRGQSFLALLAERDLVFSADISEELNQERRRLAVRYDRNLQQLARLSTENDRENIDQLRAERHHLRQRRDEIALEVRKNAPRLAAIQYPQALGFSEVREVLDPGTVMLAYSVSQDETHLFIVARGQELRVETLDIGEKKLEREVRYFRERVEPAQARSTADAESLARSSQNLYRWLVLAAEDRITAGERLLIVPDGPLHLLPFGALIRETGAGEGTPERDWQYLVEWKPLHSVLSATVYRELKGARRPFPESGTDDSPLVVAFGDPAFGADTVTGRDPQDIADFRVRGVVTRHLSDWRRLLHTRREVSEIAALYRNVRTYLGRGATEEQVMALGAEARIVHFATHGFADDRAPLDSGLVLSLPEMLSEGQGNGILQVWEIFEGLRLNADLVVLSACETGVGEIRGGEGIIGLTRAFQYAGARSVLATLWRVADDTAAELTVRFYRYLQAGMAKDEALRAAQLELIRRPINIRTGEGTAVEKDASAPYHWAAFQLVGDWR